MKWSANTEEVEKGDEDLPLADYQGVRGRSCVRSASRTGFIYPGQATRREGGHRVYMPAPGRSEADDWRVRKFKSNSIEGTGSGKGRRHPGSTLGPGRAGKEVGKAIGSWRTARSLWSSGRKKVPGREEGGLARPPGDSLQIAAALVARSPHPGLGARKSEPER